MRSNKRLRLKGITSLRRWEKAALRWLLRKEGKRGAKQPRRRKNPPLGKLGGARIATAHKQRSKDGEGTEAQSGQTWRGGR